jgi:hypothetical protein
MPSSCLALLALGLGLALTHAQPASAQSANSLAPHPRLGLYAGANGAGFPFIRSNQTVDEALLDSVARFDSIILPASPFTEYWPQVLSGLRQRNPNIHLYAYVQADEAWPSNFADSTVHIPTLHYHLVRNLKGFLYDTHGKEFHDANINLTHLDGGGHYDVADTMADFFVQKVWNTGLWDGLFFDLFCTGILWDQSAGESLDVARAGFPSPAAFDTAWQAGTNELALRLRKKIGSAPLLIGNCGQSKQYLSMNGWMHEDFPNQNGATWDQNLFRNPGGYTVDEASFRAPQSDWLSAWPSDVKQPYSSDDMRRARFVLGSAALGDGFGTINPDSLDTATNYLQWWYDEYGVDLATGRASSRLADTGWLGIALGAYTSLPTLGPADAAALNPGFESNLLGWNFLTSAGSSWTRDTAQPAVGVASAHIAVAAPGVNGASTHVATAGYLSLWPSHAYRISFWMRAAQPRTVVVAAVNLYNGHDEITRSINPTAYWQHFDLDVTAPPYDATVDLEFRVGGTAIDTWIDDAHFTQSGLALYRRDFENGIVLVNPTAAPMSALLDVPCRRILGTVDPATNDGSVVTQATVPAFDALFLLRSASLVGAGPAPDAGTPRLAWRAVAPNPLPRGGVTVARFVLPRAAGVDVTVFDPAGRRVRSFGQQSGSAGENSVLWDGRSDGGARLPRGLYFVRARAGDETATRKLVLE